ncbi:hypothetical protein SAICODRAFT_189837 [Saitoella complicata NRRL Y-17804]|uniref:Uncharacterized protein n=1 Tax=Saitoella complicata (strain BCRC 22490 / CBS 7301 / JCM 7358 / NBRC 10748 / NRRL Y-17804) TaxID=698492 RepID=A0A0E9NPU0_SAICN|nr:uncharacterized protein SAICODRAFT_189837 [Saitoella complicata NRRL Y-17804]ODQ49772.1 hypothetical protein SAICODRAFT_189837 [Saitoella complicata NRRL Y-17804]GAO51833.1 hypothetical protein G7K_5924-t1 [Saitoella complicata NRRL Y-17804]
MLLKLSTLIAAIGAVNSVRADFTFLDTYGSDWSNTSALPAACLATLNTTIPCDLSIFYTDSIGSPTTGGFTEAGVAKLESFCTQECLAGMEALVEGAARHCPGVYGDVSPANETRQQLYYYNFYCLRDSSTDELCAVLSSTNQTWIDAVGSISNDTSEDGAEWNMLPDSVVCSDCVVGYIGLALEVGEQEGEDYDGFNGTAEYASISSSIQSRCNIDVATVAVENAMLVSASATATASASGTGSTASASATGAAVASKASGSSVSRVSGAAAATVSGSAASGAGALAVSLVGMVGAGVVGVMMM